MPLARARAWHRGAQDEPWPCTWGNAMNMGGETLQLLPRVLLADSPFALGATGSKAPLQRVPGWGWISELMLSTANRSRQLWEAP